MSKESSLSPEAKSVLGAMVSRRGLLAGAGGIGAVGLLSACGSSSCDVYEAPADAAVVRWGNWPLYLDYDEECKYYPTLDKFARANTLNAKYFEDYTRIKHVMSNLGA